MPGAVLGDVEARIAELVEQHRPELEQLVDRALAREIETLVTERITATNGVHESDAREDDAREDDVPAPEASSGGSATKVCTSCGQDKPTSAFDKYRRACKDCRRVEMRERARARANGGHMTRERGTDGTPREIEPVDADQEPPRPSLTDIAHATDPGPPA